MKKNVVILFGGESSEHDISVVSGFYIKRYFDEYLYNINMVYMDKNHEFYLLEKCNTINDFVAKKSFKQVCLFDGVMYLIKGKKIKQLLKVDVVFPILHGVGGEDGVIDGFLKINNFCRVTPDVLTGAVGLDKSMFKRALSNFVPMLPFVELKRGEKCPSDFIKENVGFPCIVKPASQGSSIGIEICKNEENFEKNVKKCLKFDKKVIIEPYLTKFREFNVAIYSLNGELKISQIEEPIVKNDMLGFKDKYLTFSGNNDYESKKISPEISKKLSDDIINIASKTYNFFDAHGVIRFDFLYDCIDKKLYLNEMNTIPGSLALYLFSSSRTNEGDVLNDLVEDAEKRYFAEKNKLVDFKSDVLKSENITKFNK